MYSHSPTASMLTSQLQKLVLRLKETSEHTYTEAIDSDEKCEHVSLKERSSAAISVNIEV